MQAICPIYLHGLSYVCHPHCNNRQIFGNDIFEGKYVLSVLKIILMILLRAYIYMITNKLCYFSPDAEWQQISVHTFASAVAIVWVAGGVRCNDQSQAQFACSD